MEIVVHPELCVGTVREALSKLDDTLKNKLDSLKKEGTVNWKVLSGQSFAFCTARNFEHNKSNTVKLALNLCHFLIHSRKFCFMFLTKMSDWNCQNWFLSSSQRWRRCTNMQVKPHSCSGQMHFDMLDCYVVKIIIRIWNILILVTPCGCITDNLTNKNKETAPVFTRIV